jgi:hypothetical protein
LKLQGLEEDSNNNNNNNNNNMSFRETVGEEV